MLPCQIWSIFITRLDFIVPYKQCVYMTMCGKRTRHNGIPWLIIISKRGHCSNFNDDHQREELEGLVNTINYQSNGGRRGVSYINSNPTNCMSIVTKWQLIFMEEHSKSKHGQRHYFVIWQGDTQLNGMCSYRPMQLPGVEQSYQLHSWECARYLTANSAYWAEFCTA
jgi:hypothetical protein